MGNPKTKYCKCGHEKNLHKDPKSKLSFSHHCRKCQCSSYMNRKKPFKSDYVFTVITVGMAALIMIMSFVILTETDPALTGNENIIVLTSGELHEIIILVFVMINMFMIVWFVIDPIIDILHTKKRPEFPLDDKND